MFLIIVEQRNDGNTKHTRFGQAQCAQCAQVGPTPQMSFAQEHQFARCSAHSTWGLEIFTTTWGGLQSGVGADSQIRSYTYIWLLVSSGHPLGSENIPWQPLSFLGIMAYCWLWSITMRTITGVVTAVPSSSFSTREDPDPWPPKAVLRLDCRVALFTNPSSVMLKHQTGSVWSPNWCWLHAVDHQPHEVWLQLVLLDWATSEKNQRISQIFWENTIVVNFGGAWVMTHLVSISPLGRCGSPTMRPVAVHICSARPSCSVVGTSATLLNVAQPISAAQAVRLKFVLCGKSRLISYFAVCHSQILSFGGTVGQLLIQN